MSQCVPLDWSSSHSRMWDRIGLWSLCLHVSLAPSHLGNRCPTLPIHPLVTRGLNLTPLQLNGQVGYSDVPLEPADILSAKVMQRWPPGLALQPPNLTQVATGGADGKSFQGQLLSRGKEAGAGEKQRPLGLRGVGSAWLRGWAMTAGDRWTRSYFLSLAPSESPAGLDLAELVAFCSSQMHAPPTKAGRTLRFEPQRPRGMLEVRVLLTRATAQGAGATVCDTVSAEGNSAPSPGLPTSSSAPGNPGAGLGNGSARGIFHVNFLGCSQAA